MPVVWCDSRKLWDAVSGDELKTFPHKHIVKVVRFSHNGNHLLTGSNEKLLRVFDLNSPDSGLLLIFAAASGHDETWLIKDS